MAVFASGIVLARLLASGELGTFFLATSIVTIVATVARLGMETAAVRMIAAARGDRAQVGAVMRRSLGVALCGAVAAFIVLAAGAWEWIASHVFSSPSLAETKWAALALLLALALQVTIVSWFRGLGEMRVVALYDEFAGTVAWVAAVTVVWIAAGTASPSLAIATRAATLAGSAAAVVIVARRRLPFRRAATTIPFAPLLATGAALMATNVIASLIGSTSDLLILGAYRPPGDVAAYGVAASIAAVVALPFVSATVPLGPMIADLWAGGDRDGLERLVRGSIGPVAILTVVGAAVVTAIGRPLLATLFGAEYGQAATVLMILVAAQVVFVLTGPCGLVLVMCGRQRPALVLAVAAAVASVAADLWAAPRYGGVGVALATGLALGLDNVATTLYVRRTLGIWTVPRFAIADLRRLRELLHPSTLPR